MKSFWFTVFVASILSSILYTNLVFAKPTPGYYRSTSNSTTYFISSQDWYCHVQNPSQMEAFGGFAQIRDVHDVSQYLQTLQKNNGDCVWPNGVFKSTVDPTTFWLYEGNKFCWISSGSMLNAVLSKTGYKVRAVEPGSEIKVGRTYTEQCNWP